MKANNGAVITERLKTSLLNFQRPPSLTVAVPGYTHLGYACAVTSRGSCLLGFCEAAENPAGRRSRKRLCHPAASATLPAIGPGSFSGWRVPSGSGAESHLPARPGASWALRGAARAAPRSTAPHPVSAGSCPWCSRLQLFPP